MTKSEIREVKVRKACTVGVTCDVCGKEIKGKYWNLTRENFYPDCEIEYDLCSKECVQEKLTKYFKDCEDSFSERFVLSQASFWDNEKE